MNGVQVFHELARHLQTRRLIAGDSISLDEDKSFYCVIDGMVQVYAKTGQTTEESHYLWDDEDMNGYQLLNEVGAGGTLSSLFTILSLFTEDVQMSWQDDGLDISSDEIRLPSPYSEHRIDSDVSQLDLENPSLRRRQSSLSSASTVHAHSVKSSGSHYGSARSVTSTTRGAGPQADSTSAAPAHRAVVARALEDTTLAVIPAEAFRRLTKKYPKATGHVVQGIFPISPFLLVLTIFSYSDTVLPGHVQRCAQVPRTN